VVALYTVGGRAGYPGMLSLHTRVIAGLAILANVICGGFLNYVSALVIVFVWLVAEAL
jgi:hypothetical protein